MADKITNVVSLSKEERYDYFIRKVADFGISMVVSPHELKVDLEHELEQYE